MFAIGFPGWIKPPIIWMFSKWQYISLKQISYLNKRLNDESNSSDGKYSPEEKDRDRPQKD
jgi:hypothetical protein